MVHEHGDDAELVRCEPGVDGRASDAAPPQRVEGARARPSLPSALAVPVVGSAASARSALRRVRHLRVPEQELVDARRPRGGDLGPHLLRPVVDTEREVLKPGHDTGAGSLDGPLEVLERARDDVVGIGLGVGDPVLARPPVRRVHHRRDVVHLARHLRDVLGDLVGPRRGDAEDRRTEIRPVRRQRLPRLGEERHDRVVLGRRRGRGRPWSRAARRASHVVVEDVVDAEGGGGDRDVDVVLRARTGLAKFVKPP